MAMQNLVIFAKDVKRLSAFYQSILPVMVAESESSHELLIGEGLEIVLHAIPNAIADTIEISTPPKIREFAAIKPVFQVADLDVLRTQVDAHGASLKPAKDAWQIRGATVIDGCDPEGNVLQFKQVASG